MARPKSFNRDDVLEQAMRQFWIHGFDKTSLKDLQTATGLNPGSLYEEFGDKQGLFLAAAEHYRETVVRQRLAVLTGGPGSPRARIEGFFRDVVRQSVGEGRLMGCLMTNSIVERVPHDAETRALVAANLAEIEQGFLAVLTQALKRGELKPDTKPEAMARYLTSSLQGLRVMAKVDPDAARLNGIVDMILAPLL